MGKGRGTRERARGSGDGTVSRGGVRIQGRRRRGRTLTALPALAVSLLAPPALGAQGEPVTAPPKCETGAPVGSLGITGISCERCQFFTNGRVHRAVFWTEPTITALNPEIPAASVLQEGDILVAVDGRLITTREGSERFSALPPLGNVELRIRRDGRVRDLSVPVTAVCPTTQGTELPEVAGRPLPAPPPEVVAGITVPDPTRPVPPRPAKGTEAVVAPTPPTEEVRPALPAAEVAVPLPPAPDRMLPEAELGFGFTCSHCTYEGREGRWTFPEPPVVSGVTATVGIGPSSGLREGDRILEVNGASITTRDGARQFADIKPGDRPRWTVERDGRRITVQTSARKQTWTVLPEGTPAPADPSTAPVRFTGMVGNAAVEVRGGRVSVVQSGQGKMLIIRTRDAEIRIRVPGGEEESKPRPPSKDEDKGGS